MKSRLLNAAPVFLSTTVNTYIIVVVLRILTHSSSFLPSSLPNPSGKRPHLLPNPTKNSHAALPLRMLPRPHSPNRGCIHTHVPRTLPNCIGSIHLGCTPPWKWAVRKCRLCSADVHLPRPPPRQFAALHCTALRRNC